MNYTSIEQSKQLLELGLSPESADAIYEYCGARLETSKLIEKPIYWLVIKGFESCCKFSTSKKDIPCWSLAALLSVLPNYQLQTQDDGIGIICSCNGNLNIVTADNSVDACYEMIIRLHELNLL